MNFTERERLIILAALSYAYSNCDELNDALEHRNGLLVGNDDWETHTPKLKESEIDNLMAKWIEEAKLA
jgi:hypothetical protein